MTIKIPNEIKSLMQKLLDNNFECYIIGGAVRDSLLDIEPHDFDLFTNASGEDILRVFPEGKILGGAERQEKILTVIVDGVEISQFRSSGDREETGTDLKTHCSTCDFTINAMACDIEGNIIDYYEGQSHLKYKILMAVGDAEKRIKEDPLRILRGIRFMCKYKLSCHYRTSPSFTPEALENLSKERIREEFIKIIEYENSIDTLHEYDLLEEIIPELYHDNHFEDGGSHHNETPFEHMLISFKMACRVTTDYRIRLATLLHDIGKGDTRTEEARYECGNFCCVCTMPDYRGCHEDINIFDTHFYQHETIGYNLTKDILTRLKFSRDDIIFISTLVKKHMFGYMEDIQDKTYVKFYAELEEKKISIYDFLMVVYCDRQANLKKPRDSFGDFCKKSNEKYLLYHYNRIKSKCYPFRIKDLAIGGKDLIANGMKPGKEIGESLREIYDLVLEGEIKNSRPELMYYIKSGEYNNE